MIFIIGKKRSCFNIYIFILYKVIIYDYETREYKSNTEGNFFNIDTEQLILLTIIITILLTLIIFTLTFIIIKNKNKNNTSK